MQASQTLEITPALVEAYRTERARRTAGAYSRFKKQYRNDPVAFVHDIIKFKPGSGPTVYQDDIMSRVPIKKRVSPRGPHGLGKTTMSAWLTHWFALTRDGEEGLDWKIPTTAGAWRQLSKFLWPEIHKWARVIDWAKVGRPAYNMRTELQTLNLKLSTGEAFAVASDTPEMIEGVHADGLLYLYDEAKSIPGETFDASEGAFMGAGGDTGAEAMAFASSTPGEAQGRFYDIQSRKPGYEDWDVRPVTLEECIKAGRMSREKVAQRAKQWGTTSAVYINRVEGLFASTAQDTVIPLSWVEAAVARWHTWNDQQTLFKELKSYKAPVIGSAGVDVADAGEDKTVFAPRSGNVILPLRKHAGIETMETVGYCVGLANANKEISLSIDVIGIGAGVVSRCRELKLNVYGFNASESADPMATDRSGELKFLNQRAWAWWKLRELLDPAFNATLCLPDDDELIGDLSAPKWSVISGGRIQIESKKEIKKRIGRSTDCGDAVVMAFAVPERKEQPKELPLSAAAQKMRDAIRGVNRGPDWSGK